jgi:hypothetical protein
MVQVIQELQYEHGYDCSNCGEFLNCDECVMNGLEMYCSEECALEYGDSTSKVCKHNVRNYEPMQYRSYA